VCDIYDYDLGNPDFWIAARTNKPDTYLAASAGDTFLTVWNRWADLTEAERAAHGKNAETVADFMAQIGVQVESHARYNSLLKNSYWNALAYQFCQHRFGRDSFVISNFTEAMQQRLPQVSHPSPVINNWG
jgi:hypothetical protein